MIPWTSSSRSSANFISAGGLNRWVGWLLLLTGLALAACLDPWFFSVETANQFDRSLRPAARHVQGVAIGMGLLQLAMAYLLATPSFEQTVRQIAAIRTTLGACLYMAGYGLGLFWPVLHWLVLVGSLINLSGFAYLLRVGPGGEYAGQIKTILPVVCFGMCLDFVAGVLPVIPDSFVFEYLGSADGVRLRMMRLARVAAIALSVLTLLYYGLARPSGARSTIAGWGGILMAAGAVGMPAILALACFTWLSVKYLLPLPATAVSIGVFLGLYFALRQRHPLEWFGWGLIAASISVGMLMGLYAFEGPFETPDFLGQYNDAARRLSRVSHSYAIVLGILSIFLARETREPPFSRAANTLGIASFMSGCVATVGALLWQIAFDAPPWTLAVGPALALFGAVVCLVDSQTARRFASSPSRGA